MELRPANWLHKLLLDHPEIVPASAVRQGAGPLRLALELGEDDRGLVAFSAGGDMAVIRSQTAEAPAGSGEVLGSVLADAARLGGSTFWELDARIRERLGEGLSEAMEKRLASGGVVENWDRTTFEERVGQAVESGDLNLILALDRTDEALLRTIRFIWQAWAVVLPIHVVLILQSKGGPQAELLY